MESDICDIEANSNSARKDRAILDWFTVAIGEQKRMRVAKKGDHRSNALFGSLWANKRHFDFKMESSCADAL
jgi:hypothetical protein